MEPILENWPSTCHRSSFCTGFVCSLSSWEKQKQCVHVTLHQYLHVSNLASFYQVTDELATKLDTWPLTSTTEDMGSDFTSLLKDHKPIYSNYYNYAWLYGRLHVIMCISIVLLCCQQSFQNSPWPIFALRPTSWDPLMWDEPYEGVKCVLCVSQSFISKRCLDNVQCDFISVQKWTGSWLSFWILQRPIQHLTLPVLSEFPQ